MFCVEIPMLLNVGCVFRYLFWNGQHGQQWAYIQHILSYQRQNYWSDTQPTNQPSRKWVKAQRTGSSKRDIQEKQYVAIIGHHIGNLLFLFINSFPGLYLKKKSLLNYSFFWLRFLAPWILFLQKCLPSDGFADKSKQPVGEAS